MALFESELDFSASLARDIKHLVQHLPELPHGQLIGRALAVLLRMSSEEIDRLDWKILTATLEDLEKGFQGFYAYHHVRKVTIFGSARISPESNEYRLAVEFARKITEMGFMILTGAGGGIMQAGNEGATKAHSFGLNIQLPFEQEANPFIAGDPKLIDFKYFFTRKLFFLKESDAIALFPGGFGTQDEAFETLTLCQTGKYGPAPLVLIDEPSGDYWSNWHQQLIQNLEARGLISPEDSYLYTITDDLNVACDTIREFYRVYHSSRYVGPLFVMRLNHQLTDEQVEILNQSYSDLLIQGKIVKSAALPQEAKDTTTIHLPRLVFEFDQRSLGRLYQMINHVNQLELMPVSGSHPEWK